ncbi:uncharacterized protein [Amphiura filiformis]|uniref:uncharacterized protein n=1 Tax=Amphiura filiformis TaxID=82378 RepID=UPI003B20ED31
MLASIVLPLCVPVFLYIIVNLLLPDKTPRHGIYATPGGKWYSLKWLLIYCMLKLRHRQMTKQNKLCDKPGDADQKSAGFGIRSHNTGAEMELFTDLTDKPHDNNSVYLYGINPVDGTWIGVRIAKRQNGVREVWFFLRLPGLNYDLLLPQHPDTMVPDVNSNGFEGAGLKIEVTEPMNTWNITYEGNCRLASRRCSTDQEGDNPDQKGDGKLVYVSCSLKWRATTPYVNFDTDISLRLMAQNIAKEKWTREFFDNMKRLHQTHYEQFGEMAGSVNISGHPEQHVTARGVRDRSFGPRMWDQFYSYCLLFAQFQDGTSLHAGSFCVPNIFSHLNSGFFINKQGVIVKTVSSTLSLPDLMPETTPPKTFTFDMKMETGATYSFTVDMESSVVLIPDDKLDIKIHETKAAFTMNGIPGHGIGEWLTRPR